MCIKTPISVKRIFVLINELDQPWRSIKMTSKSGSKTFILSVQNPRYNGYFT